MFIYLWDASGSQITSEEPDGLFGPTWTAVVDVNDSQKQFIKIVEDTVGSVVTGIKPCLQSTNSVMQVNLVNGRTVILRCGPASPDDQFHQRMYGEVQLMKWLETNSLVPVPPVLAMSEPTSVVPFPYMIMPMLPGSTPFELLSRMDLAAKKNLMTSFVELGVELYRLDVPQMIGSTTADGSGGIQVVPLIDNRRGPCTDRVFLSLEEYVHFLFSSKRKATTIGTTTEEKARGHATVDKLEALVLRHIKDLRHPNLHRCILCHDSLSERNVLSDPNGKITGVLDWEFHSIRPAVLGVNYPMWLLYSGPVDPRYAINNDKFQSLWSVSPDDSKELIRHYDEVAAKKDLEYYNVLKRGEFLRTVVQWLNDYHPDPGFDRMRAWMEEETDSRA